MRDSGTSPRGPEPGADTRAPGATPQQSQGTLAAGPGSPPTLAPPGYGPWWPTRAAKVALGLLLEAVVVGTLIWRVPRLLAIKKPTDYDLSYLIQTLGFSLLLAALGLWLIQGGLWPKARGRKRR